MMNIMRIKAFITFFEEPKNWPKIFWGLFSVAAIISIWGLLSFCPRSNHDNSYEVWLSAFDSMIRSGQLLPSWIKGFWFEHGSPLFVFYPPLFFYLAEVPRLLGASLVISIKVVVALSFLLSFFTMYLLGKEFWGKWGGLFAGLLYMTAPYHFALMYIRGAYAENLAYAILPLIIWFIYKVFKESKNWWYILGMAGSLAMLILINLPSLISFTVFVLLLILGFIWQQRKFPILQLGLGSIGALALSAFFWLPVLINRVLIQSDYFITGKYHFSNYFTNITHYLPFRPWMKIEFYQWGIMAWIIILLSIAFVFRTSLFNLWSKKFKHKEKKQSNSKTVLFLLIALVIITILMMPLSYVVWNQFNFMPYIQFPYRFLSAVFVLISLLGAYVIYKVASLWKIGLLVLILLQVAIFARPVYEFRHPLYKNDGAYTIYGDIKAQLVTTPKEDLGANGLPKTLMAHTTETGYLPISIHKEVLTNEFKDSILKLLVPLSFEESTYYTVPDSDKILTKGVINNVREDLKSINFVHTHNETSRVYYRQFGFPGWQVLIDNEQVEWESSTGQISFVISTGQHNVRIEYTNPPGAITGRTISAFFLIIIVMAIIWFRKPTSKVKKKVSRSKSK